MKMFPLSPCNPAAAAVLSNMLPTPLFELSLNLNLSAGDEMRRFVRSSIIYTTFLQQ